MTRKNFKFILTLLLLIVGTRSIVSLHSASADEQISVNKQISVNVQNEQPGCDALTPAGNEQCVTLSE